MMHIVAEHGLIYPQVELMAFRMNFPKTILNLNFCDKVHLWMNEEFICQVSKKVETSKYVLVTVFSI